MTSAFSHLLPAELEPLQKRTKKDLLVHKLLEMIYQGLLRDGDTLPAERELSAMFAVSRETVRSALAVLAERGLLSVSHGAKTRVQRDEKLLQACAQWLPSVNPIDLSQHTIESVFEARIVVETHIARLAAQHIDQNGKDCLIKLLEQQASLFDEVIHFQLADQAFHQAIADIAGNAILARYAQELYSYGLYFRREVLEGACLVQESYADHVNIVAAICSGDPELAEHTMRNHLLGVMALAPASGA